MGLRLEKYKGRSGYRYQFTVGGVRRSLWLGKVPRRTAEEIARNVDRLALACETQTQPPVDVQQWAVKVSGRLRETLEKWQLIEPSVVSARTLADFASAYIATKTDVKEATREKYGHTKRMLVNHFGPDRTIASITKADCQLWYRSMLQTHAETTAGKHVTRARTIFRFAVDGNMISSNPLDGIKVSDQIDRDREHYVTRDDAARILEHCDPEQGVAFALARFAGLRPCELLRLTWSDIREDRIRVDSVKTGLRWMRLEPDVRKQLDRLPLREGRILRRWSPDANLATNLKRVIERANVKPWPKMFVNCRASCRGDLEDRFPSWVCDLLMGHSQEVADKHYRRLHDEYFVVQQPVRRAPLPSDTEGSWCEDQPANSGAGLVSAPPTGLEPVTRRLTAACSTN